ncbi:MAG: phosphotransferase [Thermoleophilia bacterium]
MRDVHERIAGALGAPVQRLEPTLGGGYTLSDRFRVHLDGGGTAFAKVATTEPLAEWFRVEHRLYREIAGPFMAELLGFDDDGKAPILLLEDLSDGIWPPPWPETGVQSVVSALAEIHATQPPEGLPVGEEWRELLMGWEEVATDAEPFLSVGIVSRPWLSAALPTLRAAAAEAQLAGDALLHLDVRSDNICLYRGRAYLVDWNWATVGNPLLDLAAWLPSLHAEGGPPPEDVIGDGAGELASLLAGFFAAQAGKPPPEGAPTVRAVQFAQLQTALPWACRALGLPPPDGG